MKITRTIKLAIRSIMSSKARSFLTMLGIIIGVAAVIVIVGLGNGMENYMTDSFKSMGTNLLTVNVGGRGSTRSVSVEDMYELAEENPELFSTVSPTVNVSATVKVGSTELEESSLSGVSEDYLDMKMQTLTDGRFLQYADVLNRSKVCVVGSYIAETYFPNGAVGETIKLSGDFYQITGVIAETADSTEGSGDDMIYLPYTTAAKLMGVGTINAFSFAMRSEDQVPACKAVVEKELYSVFGDADAYSVFSMSEILDTMNTMIGVVVTILTVIAGISLLVGGIGIMNIMLVSVTERTREIGIRKALGAKRRHVLSQFVIEAGLTSAIGGVIGIIIGYLLSAVATFLAVNLLGEPMTIAPTAAAIAVAFGVSAGIGILFGYLPARKAAYLNPIDALRYD